MEGLGLRRVGSRRSKERMSTKMGRGPRKRMLSGVASLRAPTGGDGLFAQVESEVGGGEPLRRGPLPRVGGDGDSGMAEDELRAGVVDGGGDEIAALLHGLAEGGPEKIEHVRARGGGDPADGQLAFKAERTGGIAECGAGRRFGHATSRDSDESVAAGMATVSACSLLAKKARMRRRMK